MAPHLVFGTGVLGMPGTEFQDTESVNGLLQALSDLGVTRLDTAARYPPRDPGKSELLLGAAAPVSAGFLISTKVYTEIGDGSGDLAPSATHDSLDASLTRLARPGGSVDVVFAHRPDPATPLEEQVRGLAEQVTSGRARAWGIANHPPETLRAMLDVCEREGLVLPRWYQGTYSLLSQGAEGAVFPLLRERGLSFLASHALASGFLTGKHVDAEGNPTGQFADGAYAVPEVVAAMKAFVAGCEAHGLFPVEVASRWIAHHSALKEEDGIVLGASKLVQVGETVAHIRKGTLPAPVVALAGELWQAVKPNRGSMA